MSNIFITVHSKESVEQQLTEEEWYEFRKWSHRTYHREDGPALEFADGSRHWYLNGKRHRLDGPAMQNPNKVSMWWIDGFEVHCPVTIEHLLLYARLKEFIKQELSKDTMMSLLLTSNSKVERKFGEEISKAI